MLSSKVTNAPKTSRSASTLKVFIHIFINLFKLFISIIAIVTHISIISIAKVSSSIVMVVDLQ